MVKGGKIVGHAERKNNEERENVSEVTKLNKMTMALELILCMQLK